MRLEDVTGLNEEQLEQIKKVIQSETDRVRTEYSLKIKDIETEIEQYKPKEKSQHEIELEARLKAIEDKEIALSKKERDTEIQAKLSEKGLNNQLYKYLSVGDDLNTFMDEFVSILNDTILEGSYKPSNHKATKDIVTKEQFASMGYVERAKLQETNPTLYSKLSE